MAKESPNKRKLRRQRLALSQAYKMVDLALKQRDQARFIAGALEQQLKELDKTRDSVKIKVIDEGAPADEVALNQPEEASSE